MYFGHLNTQRTSLTIFFLTFSDQGLELTQMIFLSFWSKLENRKIMIFAFIAYGNALREVVELLGHVYLNFTLFWRAMFWHAVFRTPWSSWTSGACLFELHSVFDVLFFALREVVELLGCLFELHSVLLYCIFLIATIIKQITIFKSICNNSDIIIG